ncbi:hypothetical protein DQ04_04371020 [Trypanosoma grayi]|uniref:hypothetical protein n=1 Tax=Trypanosoma grayi TaxID=71804 RepID=UPI0004F469EB|nr:hypothetical protein DQ04_04371020 [Trypanosoma grayi]KEG09966.1 hypothetical protein DQ04_04371020 [Trypanosoma grayi]
MVARKGVSKKNGGSTRSRAGRYGAWRLGGVLLGVLGIIVAAYLLRSGDSSIPHAAIVNDTRILTSALRHAEAEANVAALHRLADCTLRVGMVLEGVLANTSDNDAMHTNIVHAVKVYRSATAFGLEKLLPVLLEAQGGDAAPLQDYRHEPKLLWRWIAVASHALTAVLPEYFLAADDTDTHSEALATGLHVLLQVSNAPSSVLPAGQGPLLDCADHEAASHKMDKKQVDRWLKFCRSSFTSLDSIEVRRAAILEELIALHSDYAPLRLHYAVALALSRHAAKADVAIGLIQRERERLNTRTHLDPLHRVMLLLCEAFLAPTAAVQVEVVNALAQIDNCAQLLRPFHADTSGWRRRFRGQERPDVMDHRQAKRLLRAMRVLLAKDEESLPAGLVACGDMS